MFFLPFVHWSPVYEGDRQTRVWCRRARLIPKYCIHRIRKHFFQRVLSTYMFGGFKPFADAFCLSCSNPLGDLTNRDIPLRVRPTWTPCPGRSTQCKTRCSGRPATWPGTAITATRLSVGAATAWRTILRRPPSRRLARTRRPSTPKLFLYGHGNAKHKNQGQNRTETDRSIFLSMKTTETGPRINVFKTGRTVKVSGIFILKWR